MSIFFTRKIVTPAYYLVL